MRFKVYKKLSIESEKFVYLIRENLVELIDEYKLTTDNLNEIKGGMIRCHRCGFKVPYAEYCSKCRAPIQELNLRQLEKRIKKTADMQRSYDFLAKSMKDILLDDTVSTKTIIDSRKILNQILAKQIKLNDYLVDVKTGKRAPFVTPKPATKEQIEIKDGIKTQISEPTIPDKIVTKEPVKVIPDEIITKKPEMTVSEKMEMFAKQYRTKETKPVVLEKPEPIILEKPKPAKEVDLAREETFFTRFERGLVQYWFFYLSVILLTAGVIITVVFVVKEIPSINQQMIIIYSIGSAILIIGEIIALLSRRKQKKEKRKRELEAEGSEESPKDKKEIFPLPAFGSVIVLIGLFVLYTAGIIGFASPLSKGVVLYVSFGVAILSIGLGILNNSEMTTLAGFIPMVTLVILDITIEGTSVLNEAGVFVLLTIPIILATITAIFFKKWWGAVFMITIIPVIVCIPVVSTRMGLEFIPLLLIPLMTLLITRYEKNIIPYTHKKILVFFSLILPIIGLAIVSFPALNYLATEKPWARIYPLEIIITAITIVCTSFFYQFIQEKYLNIKSKVCIFYYIGQGTIGVFTIVMAILNREIFYGFLSSIIYFSFFFIVGCLGLVKAFKEKLTNVNTIISFVLAEIHIIFMFTLFNISPEVKLGIQFLTAIIFTLLAITVTALSKWLSVSKYLFISWIALSVINNVIFIFVQKANYWFIFSSLAIFLILSLINKEPNRNLPNYIGQVSAGILSIIMIFANLGNQYNLIFSTIFFVAFFVLGLLSTIFKNYFTLIGTIISFSIAEIHAILLLSIFNITSTFQVVIYFLIGISFIILAICFIAINKKMDVSKQIYITWIVFAVINITILSFIQKISIWLNIGAILVFLVLPILNFKPNVEIPYFIGLGSIGVLTSVLIGLNHANSMNYIFIILCFCVFFSIGVLGLIKKLQKYYTLLGSLISLGFAEAIAVLGLIFINTSTSNFQYTLYLLLAISFLVLSLITIILRKHFQVSKYVFIGWIGAIFANLLLVIFMHKVSIWFVFALILLFIGMTVVELEPNKGIVSIIGKCSVGALSIIFITTSLNNPNNFIFNIICYLLFFIIGSIGLIKALHNQFSFIGTLISFGFAEVLILLSMILQRTTTVAQISIYFVMAISFILISAVAIFLVKFIEVNKYLYLGFIGASLVNTTLLIVMQKVSSWFAFATLILFFFVTAIELKPNTDVSSIVGKCSVGALSILLITFTLNDPSNYIFNVIFYSLFFIIGSIGLIKSLHKQFSYVGTLISFAFAEILILMSMILQNTTNIAQISIYFVMAISFLFISALAIPLAKFIEVKKYLYLGFIGASLVNSILLIVMNKVSNWFAFALILLFFALTTVEREPNKGIASIVGKCSVGALSILLVTFSLNDPSNYIFNVIFYSLFFIIGSIGLIKSLHKQFSFTGTLISFAFAEILILLSMILQNTTTVAQISIYFIMAISFLLISVLAISLVKFIEVNEHLYLGFIGVSLVNSLLLLLMNKVSNWFAFATLILFFAVTAVELKPNTDRNLIIGKSAVGIFSIVMLLTTLSDPNNYVYNSVFFVLFFVLGVVGLLNVLKKYFNKIGTYISIGIAEILAILLLILMNPMNISQVSFYFIIAISFNFIAMISIVFTKVFIRSDILLIGWIICSAINTTLLGVLKRIHPIFSFVSIVLLFILVTVNNMPLFGERLEYWRSIALVTSIIALAVSVVLVTTNCLNYFPYEILVVFLIYVLANVPVFINWKKEGVVIHD
ncbi:MAG: hypothetical protein ACTSSK_01855 [Candidatus Heimdallarchaeota archaeon]